MRSAREKDTPVYLQGLEREGYEHGSRSMHRPHGTLQKCNIIADPYAPHHRRDNSRYYKDERTIPTAHKSRPKQPSVPQESRSEGFSYSTKDKESNIRHPPKPLSQPMRLGSRLGGSGTPGSKTSRNGGRGGDALWSPIVEGNINCAREVRERLHVKSQFPYAPPKVMAFHDR